MSENKTVEVSSDLQSFENREQNVGRHHVGRRAPKTESVDSGLGEIGSRKHSDDPDSRHRN